MSSPHHIQSKKYTQSCGGESQKAEIKGEETENELLPGMEKSNRGKTIMYAFYAKPMSNPLTILRRSAMPEGTKVSTVSSEILRRWKCSSEHLSGATMETITVKYMDRLAAMGYPLEWRRKVLASTLTGYMRILADCKKGANTRNRTGASTLKRRRFKKTLSTGLGQNSRRMTR